MPFLGYLVWNLSQKETHTLRLLLNAWTSPLLWTLRACYWNVCVSICWGLSKPTIHLKPVHNGPQAGFLQTYRESASNADNRRKMRSGYSLRGRTLFIPVKRDAKKMFYFSDICIVGPRKNGTFRPNGFDYHSDKSLSVGVGMLTNMLPPLYCIFFRM